VGEGVSLVREPDAGDLHVRFDERRLETERRMRTEAPACRSTATPRLAPVPRQSSTLHTGPLAPQVGRYLRNQVSPPRFGFQQRQRHDELAALAKALAPCLDGPAVQLDDASSKGEPDAEAARLVRVVRRELIKGLKNALCAARRAPRAACGRRAPARPLEYEIWFCVVPQRYTRESGRCAFTN